MRELTVLRAELSSPRSPRAASPSHSLISEPLPRSHIIWESILRNIKTSRLENGVQIPFPMSEEAARVAEHVTETATGERCLHAWLDSGPFPWHVWLCVFICAMMPVSFFPRCSVAAHNTPTDLRYPHPAAIP